MPEETSGMPYPVIPEQEANLEPEIPPKPQFIGVMPNITIAR